MSSGRELKAFYQARPAIQDARRRTTVFSSRQSSGFCARAARGEIYRTSWATGIAHTFALPVGVTAACWSVWPKSWVATPTWNNCSSIPPSFVPTSILPAPKKSGQSGNRPLGRRTDDQAARCRRCAGQSVARHSLGRADRGYRLRLGTDREFADSSRGSRQGIRRRPFCDPYRSGWRRGRDSSPVQSTDTTRIRSASLPRSQFDRALLCTTQAFQAHRHALRQTRQVLPVVYSSRVCIRLVGLIVNTP